MGILWRQDWPWSEPLSPSPGGRWSLLSEAPPNSFPPVPLGHFPNCRQSSLCSPSARLVDVLRDVQVLPTSSVRGQASQATDGFKWVQQPLKVNPVPKAHGASERRTLPSLRPGLSRKGHLGPPAPGGVEGPDHLLTWRRRAVARPPPTGGLEGPARRPGDTWVTRSRQ